MGAQDRPAAARLSPRQWRAVLRRVLAEVRGDHLLLLSGGIAFYGFIAVFPAMAAALLLYGLVADPQQVEQQVLTFASALPPDIQDILEQFLQRPAGADRGALSRGFAAAVAGALWTASAGMAGMVEGINAAYNEVDGRSFLKRRGLALVLTLGAVLFVATAVGLIAVVPVALQLVGLRGMSEVLISVLRWPLLAVALMAALAVLYRIGPDRDHPVTRWRNRGSIVATGLFLLVSWGFSHYVSAFGGADSYGRTYGALAGVVILLFWLFLSAFAVLLGAEVNAEIERQLADETADDGTLAIVRSDPSLVDTGRG